MVMLIYNIIKQTGNTDNELITILCILPIEKIESEKLRITFLVLPLSVTLMPEIAHLDSISAAEQGLL